MLTALVLDPRNAFDLARTLTDLVSGAVDGLVREVVVVDGADAEVLRLCEHAGCRVLASREVLDAGFRPKGEWLLLVRAGERLPGGWIAACARHGALGGGTRAGWLPSGSRLPLLARLLAGRRSGARLVPAGRTLVHLRARRRVELTFAGLGSQRLRVDPRD